MVVCTLGNGCSLRLLLCTTRGCLSRQYLPVVAAVVEDNMTHGAFPRIGAGEVGMLHGLYDCGVLVVGGEAGG